MTKPKSAPVPDRSSRLRALLPVGVVLAGFVVSRLVYHALGIRLDASSLPLFWQFVDPGLLRTAFGQSILYLHSQPPLFNVFLGIVVNLFPGHEPLAFASTYLALGALLSIGLYLALAGVGVSKWLSALLTLLFVTSPACVLYENWLFYTYPVCVFLVWAVVFVERFLARSRTRDALGLFALLGCAALTWSMFHLVWLVLCLAVLLLARRHMWKRILLGAVVPLVLVSGWYAKNLVLFREFTASTWTGMNFAKMTNAMLSAEERRQLYEQNVISGLSLMPPFSDLEHYGQFTTLPESTGVPVLDQRLKPGGASNYNNIAYVAISRQLLADDLRILKARPGAYLRGLADSYLNFFLPADAYMFLAANREKMLGLVMFWSTVANGRFAYKLRPDLHRTDPGAYYVRAFANTGLWLVAGYLAAFVLGLVLLLRRRFRNPAGLVLVFVWVVVVSAALIGNHTEVGENNRFRFVLDPLVLVIAGWMLQAGLTRFKRPHARPAGPKR